MRKSLLILPMTAVLAMAFVPAASAADEQNNRVHVGVTLSHPLADPKLEVDPSGGSIPGFSSKERLEVDNDNGFFFDYERMIAKKLGLKFGANFNKYDLDVSSGPRQGHFGELKQTPLTVNLLFHPAPLSHTDFYIGGGFAYVLNKKIDIENDFGPGGRNALDVDDDKTWNAQLGVDFRFGDSNFGLNLDAKYIKQSADSELGDIQVDPLIGGAALAIRW